VPFSLTAFGWSVGSAASGSRRVSVPLQPVLPLGHPGVVVPLRYLDGLVAQQLAHVLDTHISL